jgi:YggT family protein
VNVLVITINMIAQVITLLVIASVLLSYFLSPYHPARKFVDDLVEPMLAPIRRIVPSAGMLDFSPMVLILLVQIVTRFLIGVLASN